MKLSIVIVNFNSRQYLRKCLDSVRSSLFFEPFEIIVVNNDKDKLEQNYFGEGCNPLYRLKIIEINENFGFGKSCNIGAREAQGQLLMFLNPDATVEATALRKLVSVLTEDKNVAIASPIILWPSGKPQAWQFGKEKSPARIILGKMGIKEPYAQKEQGLIEADWVSGTALITKKEAYDKTGGFDESYFMYFEDVDLCRRMRQLGHKILVDTGSKVYHHSGQSFSNEKQKKKHYYKSQHYYLQKNYGWLSALVVGLVRFPYYLKNVLFKR
jgi:N-acetylglucosaminyl-diphospho-decaprenol L-rhamnosyltransferase